MNLHEGEKLPSQPADSAAPDYRERFRALVVLCGVLAVGCIAFAALAVKEDHDGDAAKQRFASVVIPRCIDLAAVGYAGSASCADEGGRLVEANDPERLWATYDGLEAAWKLCAAFDLWDQPSCQNPDGARIDPPTQPTIPRPN